MTVSTTVLFDVPQYEIASRMREKLRTAVRTRIVSGFATVEGVKAMERVISTVPTTIDTFVVGAGTYRAYEAFDRLIGMGVPLNALFVHLGHTRLTSPTAKHRFYRYHPMLHSKIYYMEHADNTASAIIGSHNTTGYALLGLNGEAAVLLEGPSDAEQFLQVKNHIELARSQSVSYSPGMKAAYSFWTTQFMEGLRDKTKDLPRDGEAKKTIVILVAAEDGQLAAKDDIVYFELPGGLGQIKSLQAEVHIYVFRSLPDSPWEGLQKRNEAIGSLWCRTLGLEMEQGGVELKADWCIKDNKNPILTRASVPFRPRPSPDMQQVRVQVYNEVFGEFEYLFESPSKKWVPVLDEQAVVQAPDDAQQLLSELDLVPREDSEWYLVKDLVSDEGVDQSRYALALRESSPDAGSYVMMSLRRRKLS